jgi:hypothetical protein
MKNKWMIWLLIFAFMISTIQVTYADSSKKNNIVVNGVRLDSKQIPINQNGSILVPLRLIFESLQAEVEYISSSRKIIGQKAGLTIELQIGSMTAYKNQQAVQLTQAPSIINGSVYVPVRFISEALGADVQWIASTLTVQVTLDEPPAFVTTDLPVKNDKGKAIKLEHQGNMNLQWFIEDPSPYQQYKGFVGKSNQLLFSSFDEIITTDREGHILKRDPYTTPRPLSIEATLMDNGYDIHSNDEAINTIWKGIPLYTDSNVFPDYKDGKPSFDFVYPISHVDPSGNLIVLIKDGLAVYNSKGEQRWVTQQWTKDQAHFSAFDQLASIHTDKFNHIFMNYYSHLLILDQFGNLLEYLPGYNDPVILDDGTILNNGYVYHFVDGQLIRNSGPLLGSMANTAISKDFYSITQINPEDQKVRWSYKMDKSEMNWGFSFFENTLISDRSGNFYVSTNGGTVHALDAHGNKWFRLITDNGTISKAQVIPISDQEVVVVVGNKILCLQINNSD